MEKENKQNVNQKFSDRQNELRLFIINFIIDNSRAFHLDDDMQLAMSSLAMSKAEYEQIVAVLIEKDGMVIDPEMRTVNFIYPVSSLKTNHHVTLDDGRQFTAMCAIDAIGAAFTLHQNTEVHSVCAVCGKPVYVKVEDGEVVDCHPKTLHALTFPLGEIASWSDSC